MQITQATPAADGRIRLMAGLSLAALAGITGVISYLHALSVVHMTGSAGPVAYLLPTVADLMIVTASMALLDAARNGGGKPPLAVLSLVVGIGSTVAMNVVAGLMHGTGGALVASLPPVALVLSLETLMGIVRRARGFGLSSRDGATGGACGHGVATTAEEGVVLAYLHGRDCLQNAPSQRHLSTAFGVARPKVASLVGPLVAESAPGETAA